MAVRNSLSMQYFSTYRFDVFHLTPPLVRPILISFDEIKSRSLILRFLNWTSVLFSSFFFCRECHWIAVFNIFISLSSFPWFLFSFFFFFSSLSEIFEKPFWKDLKWRKGCLTYCCIDVMAFYGKFYVKAAWKEPLSKNCHLMNHFDVITSAHFKSNLILCFHPRSFLRNLNLGQTSHKTVAVQ